MQAVWQDERRDASTNGKPRKDALMTGLPSFFKERRMKRFWLWVLAYFHLSDYAVCEMSRGLGLHSDYHDYDDSEVGEPWHFAELTCRRCGKKFFI